MKNEFMLFGFGRDGLPGEVDMWLKQEGEVERIARDIINACESRGDRRRRSPGDQWATLAFMLVGWHKKHAMPIPNIVMEALAHVMGLVSYDTLEPTPSKKVMERLNLPTQIEMWKFDAFLTASRLDGEADAAGGSALKRDVLGEAIGVGGRTVDGWRKLPAYQRRRDAVGKLNHSAIWARRNNQPLPKTAGVPREPEAQSDWIKAQLGQ